MKIKLGYQENRLKNKTLCDIQEIIGKEFDSLFVAVIIHGSMATNELIAYSDFDGLLIVKDKYLKSKIFKQFTNQTMKLIYQFDSLQHHSWFIIKESDLNNYPQTYFPYELFEKSVLIYPKYSIELEIEFPEKIDYLAPFKRLCQSLQSKIDSDFYPKNSFQLKSYLSEIMLLPTLYLQAKYEKGLFKKDSFELIKSHFEKEVLVPIEKASYWRLEWKQKPLNLIQKLILHLVSEQIFRKFNQKYLAAKIDPSIKKDDLINLNHKLAILLQQMENK